MDRTRGQRRQQRPLPGDVGGRVPARVAQARRRRGPRPRCARRRPARRSRAEQERRAAPVGQRGQRDLLPCVPGAVHEPRARAHHRRRPPAPSVPAARAGILAATSRAQRSTPPSSGRAAARALMSTRPPGIDRRDRRAPPRRWPRGGALYVRDARRPGAPLPRRRVAGVRARPRLAGDPRRRHGGPASAPVAGAVRLGRAGRAPAAGPPARRRRRRRLDPRARAGPGLRGCPDRRDRPRPELDRAPGRLHGLRAALAPRGAPRPPARAGRPGGDRHGRGRG
jgi:hypothetical protein